MTEREREVLYTSVCGDVTTCSSCLNFKHLAMKWWTPNRLSHLPSQGTWFTECCQLFQGLPQSTQWSENQELCGYQPPNLGILLLELHRPVWRYCLFHLAGWGYPQKAVTPSGQSLSSCHSVLWIFACAGTPLCLLCSSQCCVASIIPWY